jgi:glycosyltransferase involved in cell wall biosynthesis
MGGPDPGVKTSPGPKVSVLIPAYNRVDYLRESIESVLGGDYRDFELIVSDDCSPIDLMPVVAGFGDPRLKYRRNPVNLGVATNVRTAIGAANGTYFALLNDDDTWEHDFLDRLVPPLDNHPEAVLAFCDHYVMGPGGELLSAITERNTQFWGRDKLHEGLYESFCELAAIRRSVSPAVATLFRRFPVDWTNIPDEVGPAYDVWMAYLACRTGLAAYYVPQRLTRYRSHSEMQTGSIRHALGGAYAFRLMAMDAALGELRPCFLRLESRFELGAGISMLRSNRPREARPHIRTALRLGPSLRALVAYVLTFLPRTLTGWIVGIVGWVRRRRISANALIAR